MTIRVVAIFCIAWVLFGNTSTAQVFDVDNPTRYWLDGIPGISEGNGNYLDSSQEMKMLLNGWFEHGSSEATEIGNSNSNYNDVFGCMNTIRVSYTGFMTYYSNGLQLHSDTEFPKRYLIGFSSNTFKPAPHEDDWAGWQNEPNPDAYYDAVYSLLAQRIDDIWVELGEDPANFKRAVAGWYTVDEPSPSKIPRNRFINYNRAIRDCELNLGTGLELPIFCTINKLEAPPSPPGIDPEDGWGYSNLERYASDPAVGVINIDKYPFYDLALAHYSTWNEAEIYFPQFNADLSFIDFSCTRAFRPQTRLLSEVIQDARDLLEQAGLEYPIVSIPQGSAHKNGYALSSDDPTTAMGSAFQRLPSYAELRHQVFSSLSNGATGVLPWANYVCFHPNNWSGWLFWTNDPDGYERFGLAGGNIDDSCVPPCYTFGGNRDCDYFPNFWLYYYDGPDYEEQAEDAWDAEEAAMFANYEALFEEVESYAQLMIRGEDIDCYLSWEITDATGDPSLDGTDLNTMFIQYEDDYYLFAVNNCKPGSGNNHIPEIDVRFRLEDPEILDYYSAHVLDPYEYSESASFGIDSDPDASSERIVFFTPENNESYFVDHFNPGEVHIYRFSSEVRGVFPEMGPTALEEAIIAASDQDTIYVHGGSWLGDYVIDKDLVLIGRDNSGFPIIVGTSSVDAALTVTLGNNVTISDFSFVGGTSRGILNNGNLTLENCNVEDCLNSVDDEGGAIYNAEDAILVTRNTTFQDNSAEYGGAIYNAGNLTLYGCLLKENTASEDGGGIYSIGVVTLGFDEISGKECVFADNYAPTRHLLIDYSGTPIRPAPLEARHTRFFRELESRSSDPPADEKLVQIITNQPHDYVSVLDDVLFVDGRFTTNSRVDIENSTFAGYSYIEGSGLKTYSSCILPGHAADYSDHTHCYFIDEGDPKFVDPENVNFSLKWDSPCLDAGSSDPDLRDQDHTQNDIGYTRFYREVNLVTEVEDYTQLEKGVYYADEDLDMYGLKLPSGSVLLLGSEVDITVDAVDKTVMLGEQEDAERTVITFYNPVVGDEHDPPSPARGGFCVMGDSDVGPGGVESEDDFVIINHLRYVEGGIYDGTTNASLVISEAGITSNDLRFCFDCDQTVRDESSVRGSFYIGQGCSGSIENTILRGSQDNQLVIFDSDINISSCELFDYVSSAVYLFNFGQNIEYELNDINCIGAHYDPPVHSLEGIHAVYSSFRLTDSRITDHTSFGINTGETWCNMNKVAHNFIEGNSRTPSYDGQIYLVASSCQLDCGANRINENDLSSNIPLIIALNGNEQLSTDVSFNDWGITYPLGPGILPDSWGWVIYQPLYEWEDIPPSVTDCLEENEPGELFALGNWQEINEDFETAVLTYKSIIKDYPGDPFAKRAAFRLNYISGKGYDEGMSVMTGYEELQPEIENSNYNLEYFVEGSYWELYSNLINSDTAIDTLEVLQAQAETESASDFFEMCIAYIELCIENGGNNSAGPQVQPAVRARATLSREQEYLERVETIYAVEDREHASTELPLSFALEQNYPNPFNPRTTINYTVPRRCELELSVYNILGQRVVVLAEGAHQSGEYMVQFDGSSLASGLYFYRLSTPDKVMNRKMLLVK